jgi:DASH complex subunit DAD2
VYGPSADTHPCNIPDRYFIRKTAKLPKPKSDDQEQAETTEEEGLIPLPQTLVRIPTEHAPTIQAQAEEQGETEE